MAFSRAHRRVGGDGAREGRDRHAIVGLSGWLFADLLLAVAVIFLVASQDPKLGVGLSAAEPSKAGAPVARLVFKPELPLTGKDSLPTWSENAVPDGGVAGVGIQVSFSERVRGFGDSLEDIEQDFVFEATVGGEVVEGRATGWSVKSLKPVDPGQSWLVMIEPTVGFQSTTMNFSIAQAAVVDEDGNPNLVSAPLLFLVQRRPDTVIDTAKAAQINVPVRGSSCDAESQPELIEELVAAITKVRSYTTNVAGKTSDRKSQEGNFVDWVESDQGFGSNAKIGFAFIFGSGARGGEFAERWRNCVVASYRALGWLGAEPTGTADLPVKTYNELSLSQNFLKLELYFFSGVASSD